MQIRFEELPRPATLPKSYVLITFYGGTSNFPLGCFYVQEEWWRQFKEDPELVIVPAEKPGTMTVETWKPAAEGFAANIFNHLKDKE